MSKSRLVKNLLLSVLLPLGLGVLAILQVINSANGYVAGFVFLPLLILIVLGTLGLFIAGAIVTGMKGRPGLWVLLSAPMLFCGFFGGAMVAKQFEIGAYREDPMIPMTPPVTNIVLFKKDITNDQMNQFWNETLSTSRPDGRGHDNLPGLQGIGRLGDYDGHDVVEFSFFESATEEQRQYVYARVESSPYVFELRKNVLSKDYMPTPETLSGNQSQNTKKEVTIDSTPPSH
jgi:hypothetical protein